MKIIFSIIVCVMLCFGVCAGTIDSSGYDTNTFVVSKTAGTVTLNTNSANPKAASTKGDLAYALALSNQVYQSQIALAVTNLYQPVFTNGGWYITNSTGWTFQGSNGFYISSNAVNKTCYIIDTNRNSIWLSNNVVMISNNAASGNLSTFGLKVGTNGLLGMLNANNFGITNLFATEWTTNGFHVRAYIYHPDVNRWGFFPLGVSGNADGAWGFQFTDNGYSLLQGFNNNGAITIDPSGNATIFSPSFTVNGPGVFNSDLTISGIFSSDDSQFTSDGNGNVTAVSFTGDVPASDLTGTVPMGNLSANVTTNSNTLSGMTKGDGARGVTNATPGVDFISPSNLTNFLNSGSIFYVATNGNNLTAVRGSPNLPWKSVTAAITNSYGLTNIVISVGPGTFTNESTSGTLRLTNNLAVVGSGRGITSWSPPLSLVLWDGASIQDMTLFGSNVNVVITTPSVINTPSLSCHIRRCDLNFFNDGVDGLPQVIVAPDVAYTNTISVDDCDINATGFALSYGLTTANLHDLVAFRRCSITLTPFSGLVIPASTTSANSQPTLWDRCFIRMVGSSAYVEGGDTNQAFINSTFVTDSAAATAGPIGTSGITFSGQFSRFINCNQLYFNNGAYLPATNFVGGTVVGNGSGLSNVVAAQVSGTNIVTDSPTLSPSSNATNYTATLLPPPGAGTTTIFGANTNICLSLINTNKADWERTIFVNNYTSSVNCNLSFTFTYATNQNINYTVSNGWAAYFNFHNPDTNGTNVSISDSGRYHH